MNHGQKSYTIAQYNKQRSRQGLDPIPNPFDKAQNSRGVAIVENQDGTKTVTEKTPGRPPILPIGGQQAVNNANAPGPAEPGQGPIIDALRKQTVAYNERQAQIEQQEIDYLNDFFNSDAGIAFLDSIATDNNAAELAQFSGEQAPARPVSTTEDPGEGTSGMSAPVGRPRPAVKRPADGGQGGNSAPPNPAEAVGAASTSGTGHNSGSDGGFDSAQGPVSFLPSGGYKCTGGQMTFTKVHRMKSWAIPYWNIASTTIRGGANLVTTPLVKIPWEYPFFYMSEEEFKLIPAGSYIHDARIELMQTVSSVGYPTGGTTSTQATTNHPKVMCIGKDLEAKCRGGVTQAVTLNDSMVPQTLASPTAVWDDFIAKQYGTDQTAADNAIVVPGCAHKIPFYNSNHFCIYQPNAAQAVVRKFDANNAPGFEYFQNYITEVNSNDTTWDYVDSMYYKFENAPIGVQFPSLEIVTDNVINTIGSAQYYNARRTATLAAPTENLTVTESLAPTSRSTLPVVTYKSSTMEKGAHYVRGDANGKPARQPSFHIGMRAIDKLSPSASSSRASEFVQANIEFEIKVTLRVNLPTYPNRFIRPKYYNTSIENAAQGSGNYPLDGETTRLVTWGLYNVSSTAPAVNAMDQADDNETTEDNLVVIGNGRRPRRSLPRVAKVQKKKK